MFISNFFIPCPLSYPVPASWLDNSGRLCLPWQQFHWCSLGAGSEISDVTLSCGKGHSQVCLCARWTSLWDVTGLSLLLLSALLNPRQPHK